MLRSAMSELGLHSLPMLQKWDARYIWINPSKFKPGAVDRLDARTAWLTDGRGFDPRAQHILSLRSGHEKISTAILPIPLIQEGQLSVTGERMGTKYW